MAKAGIDFKNTVIIMTSNAGTDLIAKLFADPKTAPDAAGLAEALRPELSKHFKPAFLGRVTLVPYFPLPDAIIRQIVVMQLERIRVRVHHSYRATFAWDADLVEAIAARCTESASGARNIENILSRTLLPELSAEVFLRGWPRGSRLAGFMSASRPINRSRSPSTDHDTVVRLFEAKAGETNETWPYT